MAIYDQILGVASSQDWVSLGLNVILSTLIGGLVIIALVAVLSRLWKEEAKLPNAFLMVLLISAISMFGFLGILYPYMPGLALYLPVLVWLLLTKLFFPQMKWWHTIVVGLAGYALSILLIPNLVGMFSGFLPSF